MQPIAAYAPNETLGWNAGAGTSVAYGNSTMGSWVEFGQTTLDLCAITVRAASLSTAGTRMCVDIGISSTTGDGSPEIVAENIALCVPGGAVTLRLPLRIPAGAYVYMRGARIGGTITITTVIEGEAAHPSLHGGYRYIGGLNISSYEATTNIGGASADTWVEAVAATSTPLDAVGLILSNGSDTTRTVTTFTFELGVGASSSEVVLLRGSSYHAGSASHSELVMARQYVPAGKRIAVKTTGHTSDTTLAAVIGFIL